MIFVVAASALLTALRAHGQHLIGWAFGGVGAGIALSGGLVLALHGFDSGSSSRSDTWQQAWWLTAALCLLLAIPAWSLPTDATLSELSERSAGTGEPGREDRIGSRWFTALLAAYTLEGIGYIIAGTFLGIATIVRESPTTTHPSPSG